MRERASGQRSILRSTCTLAPLLGSPSIILAKILSNSHHRTPHEASILRMIPMIMCTCTGLGGLARAPAGGARAFESVGSRRRAPLSAPAADRSRRARRDRPFRCCCESLALPSPRLCCPHHPTGPARRRDVRARGRRARADDTRARASPGGDSHPAKLTPLDAARKWGGDATASEVVAFFFRGPEREERDTARYRRSVTQEWTKQSPARRRNFHLSWRLGYFRVHVRHFPVWSCNFFFT